MADYYSDSAGIQVILGNLVPIGTGRAEVPPEKLVEFQRNANADIDMMLSTTYQLPLKKLTRGVVVAYPDTIRFIANRMVAAQVIDAYYASAQPNMSSQSKIVREEAMHDLLGVINGVGMGMFHLEGQRMRGKNRFVRPQVAPQPIPATATELPAGGMGITPRPPGT